MKPKTPSEAPPLEMYVLRSQILASHNNICSDTHLQSHINAELGLGEKKSTRREKVIFHESLSRINEPPTFVRFIYNFVS